MARLHRTRKESVEALHRALGYIWLLIHESKRELRTIKLSDISRAYHISTLPLSLVKPYVLCERQPTFASAAELRELLSINSRAKGGKRNHTNASEQSQRRTMPTLFNLSNYEAVEGINRLQDILTENGYNGYNIEITLRDGSYTVKLEITKQIK